MKQITDAIFSNILLIGPSENMNKKVEAIKKAAEQPPKEIELEKKLAP